MIRLFIIIFISCISAQQGEIVNATAQQKTDGSGIVEVTYELLPDETFPSFEVTANLGFTEAIVYWKEIDPVNHSYEIYINSGSFGIEFMACEFNNASDATYYVASDYIDSNPDVDFVSSSNDRLYITSNSNTGDYRFIKEAETNIHLFTVYDLDEPFIGDDGLYTTAANYRRHWPMGIHWPNSSRIYRNRLAFNI